MVSLVSGGAGFIGSNLVARLLDRGQKVVAVDNFVRGSAAHLGDVAGRAGFTLIDADLASAADCRRAFDAAAELGRIEAVWHLAANSDIPAGGGDPRIDLRDTFLTTFEILIQIKRLGIGRLLFASSSAIYGDHGETALTEDTGPLFPISNYGAMKLASEAQISASVESFLPQAVLFRFPNVIGLPATHGVILDFIRRLKDDLAVLRVLGDGTQRKPYLHVAELVEAMLFCADKAGSALSAYNIGPADDGVTVRWIAEQVVARVSPQARLEFGVGAKGWVGDVPCFRYANGRLADLGWTPSLSSADAMVLAIDEIARAEGV